ncbi:hypothetical protein EAS64_33890 [Trebonia kvetii]|uniref:Uncharacterized protein n=1 Tax=Trebonia kvetii TaxID=2480626 RepID=A0A6P2BVN6_9ACTN|nr:hypothetical protein [Trebonia kvetii]TVZ01273.1 hypothetical protein EAS64_33890 [Trebonia kvetii]
MRVTLDTSDNWAELREVADLRRPDRLAVNKAISLSSDGEGRAIIPGSMEDDMATALLPLVITEWSLPYPVPAKRPDALSFLTLEQDDALRAAIVPHLKAIQGVNAPTPTNETPTAPSAS